MKNKFARDIGLLLLPVLALGGLAWWKGLGFSIPFGGLSAVSKEGPLRLEFSPFLEAEVSPLEVSKGFVWKASSFVAEAGTLQTPAAWRRQGVANWGMTRDLRLIYRKGNVWKTAPSPINGDPLFNSIIGPNTVGTTILANLSTVPADAEEVHLKGRFSSWLLFWGNAVPGWKMPKGSRTFGKAQEAPLESKPFDVEIKGVGQPLPDPDVPHAPKIELRGTYFYSEDVTDSKGQLYTVGRFLVHLHHLEKKRWASTPSVALQNAHVFDATGKEIDLFWRDFKGEKVDKGNGVFSGIYSQDQYSPLKSSDDIITGLLSTDVVPKHPWESYKQPLRIEFDASDGTCWPSHLRAIYDLRKAPGKMNEFGAPPAQ